jgi:GntR family transcriptional regulator
VTEDAPNELERMRLGPQDRIYRIHRTRMHKNQPFMVENATVPITMFASLDEKAEVANRIMVLAQQYGVLLGKAEERVSIGQAAQAVADILGIPAGTSVMVLDRVVQSLVEWRVGWCHLADKYYQAEMI